MSRKRNADLDELLDNILTDADGAEEQLWALRQAIEDNVKVPVPLKSDPNWYSQ